MILQRFTCHICLCKAILGTNKYCGLRVKCLAQETTGAFDADRAHAQASSHCESGALTRVPCRL